MREERTRLALGLPLGVLWSWRRRGFALVTVVSETADVEDTDGRRVGLGCNEFSALDDGTAVRVDAVERDDREEAGDGERGGDTGVPGSDISRFSCSRAC